MGFRLEALHPYQECCLLSSRLSCLCVCGCTVGGFTRMYLCLRPCFHFLTLPRCRRPCQSTRRARRRCDEMMCFQAASQRSSSHCIAARSTSFLLARYRSATRSAVVAVARVDAEAGWLARIFRANWASAPLISLAGTPRASSCARSSSRVVGKAPSTSAHLRAIACAACAAGSMGDGPAGAGAGVTLSTNSVSTSFVSTSFASTSSAESSRKVACGG